MMYLDMKWAEMSKRSLAGQTERMLPYYEKMKPQMKHNPLFLYNYAAELNYIGRHEESLVITEECMKSYNDYDVQFLLADNLANTDNIDQAIETYRYAGNMIPCRFEPLDGMMTLYLGSGDTLNAVRIAREIVAKPVKVPSSRVNVIVAAAKQLIE
jgi:tetratricopeptide (TPR) repeat protein